MKYNNFASHHSHFHPVIKYALISLSVLIIIGAGSLVYMYNQSSIPDVDLMKLRTVSIAVDGRSFSVKTHLSTVKEVLDSNKIFVGPNDIVEPGLTNDLNDKMRIHVSRLSISKHEYTVKVPYPTVYYNDNTIDEGKEVIIQSGTPGLQKVSVYQRSINGEIKTSSQQNGEMILPYTSEVIAIGKKPVPIIVADTTQQELPSSPPVAAAAAVIQPTVTPNAPTGKYTIQAELTAYTAGVESTGKHPGDKGYGITFSGATVKEEHTISVDPTVIPLNWWVYIEGIGYRKAEDTGSAIKGNRIDVFMGSLDDAKRFGRKTNITVHVIGPEKPE